MIAKTLPEFMQRKINRKTANITRLTDTYKSQVDAMTGDYETKFSQYQAQRAEKIAPYDAAVKQYQTDFTGYEQAAAAYKQKLTDYTALLEDINKSPLEKVNAEIGQSYRNDVRAKIDGVWYRQSELPEGYTLDIENKTLYKARDAGKFTEAAPKAPEAPVAPDVPEFDSSQFDAKKQELKSNLERDIGEVKAARIGAVSRKSARPMLQGVANG